MCWNKAGDFKVAVNIERLPFKIELDFGKSWRCDTLGCFNRNEVQEKVLLVI